jgi:hypothetical protein
MSRDGSGVYQKANPDFVALTTIESAKVNGNFDDVAQDLNNLTNGTNFWTGPIKAAVGTVLLPGYTFNGDPNSGFYWIGANNVGLSLDGVKRWDFGTATSALTGALTVSGATTVSGAFTSLGIDDNATAERLDITNTLMLVGSATAASDYTVGRPVESGSLLVVGGTDVGAGYVQLYGNTHATKASDIEFHSNSVTVYTYDRSATDHIFAGTVTLPNTGLHLLDTNATHDLIIAPGSNLTADRTLTITTGDAAHTLDISGAPTSVVIASGTYSPTITNGANIAASTTAVCLWSQLGDRVTVSGQVNIDPTAAAPTDSLFELSLPVASNFGALADCGGVANAHGALTESWGCFANTTNDTASFRGNATTTANHTVTFVFMYRVI